jgi:hypothetical protein
MVAASVITAILEPIVVAWYANRISSKSDLEQKLAL